MPPMLTIIVPAYNEEKRLGATLKRMLAYFDEQGAPFEIMAVPGIHDTQCGFKLFTRSAAQSVFSRCTVDHFAFDVEVLYVAMRIFGYRVAETPIRWAHQEGSSVVFWRDAFRMTKTLLKIRLTRYQPPATAANLNPR